MAAQIIAVGIFVLMFVMIMLDKVERCVVTLGAGAATLILVFGKSFIRMTERDSFPGRPIPFRCPIKRKLSS